MDDLESIARTCVDCGYQVHKEIGPGLLESVYEVILAELLSERGLKVARQVQVPITFRDKTIENAFKADMIVCDRLVIELKSTERHSPVHAKQLLTYLRLMNLPLGLLMNFGMSTFKEGTQRLANQYFGTR